MQGSKGRAGGVIQDIQMNRKGLTFKIGEYWKMLELELPTEVP